MGWQLAPNGVQLPNAGAAASVCFPGLEFVSKRPLEGLRAPD